jgi:archaellum component FlaC
MLDVGGILLTEYEALMTLYEIIQQDTNAVKELSVQLEECRKAKSLLRNELTQKPMVFLPFCKVSP